MKLPVNCKGGKIIFDEFNIDISSSLSAQILNLQEDLLQIKYSHNYVIDLGWYPELDPHGSFVIYIIKNSNWESPLYKKNASVKNIEIELQKAIDQTILYISNEKNITR